MKRRVIRQANKAYTITLPIKWARDNALQAGSELDVQTSGKALVINAAGKQRSQRAELDAREMDPRSIRRHINSLYARGVDEITLLSNKDIGPFLSKSLNGNLGFALVSHLRGNYLLKDIAGGSYDDLDEIFRRVFQIAILFFDDAINDIFGQSAQTLQGLRERDMEVNKFALYLQRAINKQSYPDPVNGRIIFTYSYALEKIGDEVQRLWRTHVKYGIKAIKGLEELTSLARDTLVKAFNAYFQHSSKRIDEVFILRDRARKKAEQLDIKDKLTARFARHVLIIAEDAADLGHLSMMRKT